MTGDSSQTILLIGLDGGTWALLGPVLARGLMPSLAALRARSAWGELRSTQPPFTAPAWASFMTGLNPGGHGVLSFEREGGGLVNGASVAAPRLWDWFSSAGRRVAVVNVPLTYPPSPVNGLMISGMLTPPGSTHFTYPPQLAYALSDYVIDLDYLRQEDQFDLDHLPRQAQLLADITQMTRGRGEAALRLLRREPWDLFAVVFTGTDRLGHFFWHVLDTAPSEREAEMGTAIDAYWSELDRWIGALVDAVGPQAAVLVMSDHGFGPAPTRWVHLNAWLLSQGWLRLRSRAVGWKVLLRRSVTFKRWLKALLPQRAWRAARASATALIDPCSPARFVPLYTNVGGIVFSEETTESNLRQEIAQALEELKDPFSGELLVQRVEPREALYRGPFVETMPHLIVTLADDCAAVPGLGTSNLLEPVRDDPRTGDHRSQGILLAAGPGVRVGARITGAQITDLMPTLLYWAGMAVPKGLDGRVLSELFTADYIATHSVRIMDVSPGVTVTPVGGIAYTPEEAVRVQRRLAGLGYL